MVKKSSKVKFRKPVARKATRPMSTKKGKRGYDRKKDKAVNMPETVEREEDE